MIWWICLTVNQFYINWQKILMKFEGMKYIHGFVILLTKWFKTITKKIEKSWNRISKSRSWRIKRKKFRCFPTFFSDSSFIILLRRQSSPSLHLDLLWEKPIFEAKYSRRYLFDWKWFISYFKFWLGFCRRTRNRNYFKVDEFL